MPKVLQGWIGPQDLVDVLKLDIDAANRKLSDFSCDLLRAKDGLALRPYQIEAIEKTEAAVKSGQQTALVEMAAGTGKTRIVPGMIYRFLKTGRFKRVLVLVNNSGGGRIPDVFKDVMIENNMPLEQIYDINSPAGKGIGRNTKIHVSTVQTLFDRIFIDGGASTPQVTDYDLVIADEAYSAYTAGRATDGEEQLYDSDRASEYRAVLDYFDAVKIVLTADSAQHICKNFGKPVFSYSHNSAVAEGYLIL
jgi:type I restriction enzyme R subunit